MTDITRYDVVPIKAVIDPETGYLHDSPIVTRTGIFEYKRADGSIQREYRPASSVFHPDHLKSLTGKPIVEGHPGMMTSKTVRKHQIGTVLGPGRQDGDSTMVADVVLHDPSPVTERGITELSLGYRITLDETPGVTPEGEKYDAVQTAIVCNHLGVVPRGRAGVSRFNLDSADVVETNGDTEMPDEKLADVRLDTGITYKAAPEVVHAVTKLQTDLAAAVARADAAVARADAATATADSTRAALDTAKAAHDTEVARIRSDAVAQVRARLDMESHATRLKVVHQPATSDHDLRVAVIRAVRGDALTLDGKSADYVAAAYDLAITDSAVRADALADQRRTVAGIVPGAVVPRADTRSAHDIYVANLSTAWQQKGSN